MTAKTLNEAKTARGMAQMAVHMQHTHETTWRNGKAPSPHIQGLIHAAIHKEPGSVNHRHPATITSIDQDEGLAVVDNYQPKPYDKAGEGADETVTCPKCGCGNADDAKYCDQCGFHLQGADGVKVKDLSNRKADIELDWTAWNQARAQAASGVTAATAQKAAAQKALAAEQAALNKPAKKKAAAKKAVALKIVRLRAAKSGGTAKGAPAQVVNNTKA